jgi:hypothetical protein
MAIAPTLQKYLDQNVTYEVIPHEPTLSSMRTAEACHISGDGLAKGIAATAATCSPFYRPLIISGCRS